MELDRSALSVRGVLLVPPVVGENSVMALTPNNHSSYRIHSHISFVVPSQPTQGLKLRSLCSTLNR
jgi:hypothetical protein